MQDYAYLFEEFKHKVVTDAADDAVKTAMTKIASDNGLSIVFNKAGVDEGGAAVMPPDNQVNVRLTQGTDNQWRVNKAR